MIDCWGHVVAMDFAFPVAVLSALVGDTAVSADGLAQLEVTHGCWQGHSGPSPTGL